MNAGCGAEPPLCALAAVEGVGAQIPRMSQGHLEGKMVAAPTGGPFYSDS